MDPGYQKMDDEYQNFLNKKACAERAKQESQKAYQSSCDTCLLALTKEEREAIIETAKESGFSAEKIKKMTDMNENWNQDSFFTADGSPKEDGPYIFREAQQHNARYLKSREEKAKQARRAEKGGFLDRSCDKIDVFFGQNTKEVFQTEGDG